MSGISSVSTATASSYAVAPTAANKAVQEPAAPKPAPASTSSGMDSDGDYDGGRIDVKA
jgi:hypothetical protein